MWTGVQSQILAGGRFDAGFMPMCNRESAQLTAIRRNTMPHRRSVIGDLGT